MTVTPSRPSDAGKAPASAAPDFDVLRSISQRVLCPWDRVSVKPHASPVLHAMFLAGVRGDRIRCLGVTDFGQSSDLDDAYALHGIDVTSITDAALTLAGR